MLSVVIPTFNRAGFVRDCLTSLGQSGVTECEIFVVDDGGTDDTETVVRQHPVRATYLRQENSGPAAARNLGYRHSRGSVLAFLDCDDEWLPEAPGKALRLLESYPEIDVLFGNARMGNRTEGFVSWIDVAGEEVFRQLPAREPWPGLRILERGPFFQRMAERNAVFLGSCLMRREAFERVGQFDPELCGAADWHLWLRIASHLQFAYWAEPMSIYTRHLGGMSNDHDGMSREFCTTLKKLQSYEPLTPEQRKWVRERLRHHLFGYAYRAYHRGDFPEARRRFADLLRSSGVQAKGLLYYSLSALPWGLAGGLRKLKHRLTGDSVAPAEHPAQSSAVHGAARGTS